MEIFLVSQCGALLQRAWLHMVLEPNLIVCLTMSEGEIPQTEVVTLQSFHLRSFHFNELKTATTNFCRPDSIMAQGGLGSVYKGWIYEHSFTAGEPGTSIAVVIKRFSQQRTLQSQKDWLTEVSFLGHLGQPNLVKLIGYCLKDDMRLRVHEFISQGSLNIHRKGFSL